MRRTRGFPRRERCYWATLWRNRARRRSQSDYSKRPNSDPVLRCQMMRQQHQQAVLRCQMMWQQHQQAVLRCQMMWQQHQQAVLRCQMVWQQHQQAVLRFHVKNAKVAIVDAWVRLHHEAACSTRGAESAARAASSVAACRPPARLLRVIDALKCQEPDATSVCEFTAARFHGTPLIRDSS